MVVRLKKRFIRGWRPPKKILFEGEVYPSEFEAKYARQLSLRKKAGEIKTWKSHVPISLMVEGYEVGKYKIDFVVSHLDGTIEFVEVKGRVTAVWALKWKIFEAMYKDHPRVKLTVVMQSGTHRLRKIKRPPEEAVLAANQFFDGATSDSTGSD